MSARPPSPLSSARAVTATGSVQGLENNNDLLLLSGAIPAAALALLVQWGFDLLDRAVVPKGLRG